MTNADKAQEAVQSLIVADRRLALAAYVMACPEAMLAALECLAGQKGAGT